MAHYPKKEMKMIRMKAMKNAQAGLKHGKYHSKSVALKKEYAKAKKQSHYGMKGMMMK